MKENVSMSGIRNIDCSEQLVRQVLLSCMSNKRQICSVQKTRAMVRGGGKKPWRQKGTGSARVGSSRNPIWRGGGVTFANTGIENFNKKINKKMYWKALACVINGFCDESRVNSVDHINMKSFSTKNLLTFLEQSIGKENMNKKVTIFIWDSENAIKDSLRMACSNIRNVNVSFGACIDFISLIGSDSLLFIGDSFDKITEVISEKLGIAVER